MATHNFASATHGDQGMGRGAGGGGSMIRRHWGGGWRGPHLLQGNPGVLNRWTLIDLLLLPLSACAHTHTHTHTTHNQLSPSSIFLYRVPNPSCMTWKPLPNPQWWLYGQQTAGKQIKIACFCCSGSSQTLEVKASFYLKPAWSNIWSRNITALLYLFLSCLRTLVPQIPISVCLHRVLILSKKVANKSC